MARDLVPGRTLGSQDDDEPIDDGQARQGSVELALALAPERDGFRTLGLIGRHEAGRKTPGDRLPAGAADDPTYAIARSPAASDRYAAFNDRQAAQVARWSASSGFRVERSASP